MLGDQIGAGTMGLVHEAHDPALLRTVAVKRARLDAAGEPERALLNEAATLARLDHPNIVPLHALQCPEPPGAAQLVMKYVGGTRWSDLAAGHADLDRDLRIALAVADALRFAHARGIVHCDVKPDDVVIGEFDDVYVMDWGSACAVGEAPASAPSSPNNVTPELRGSDRRAYRSTDVFGLGAALHNVLTGRPRGLDQRSGPELPEELGYVLDKACASAPSDRYETVEELATALRAFSAHREAAALAAAGLRLVDDELRAAIDANDPGAWLIFSEARLRLDAALESWPECPSAREGLSRAVDWIVPWTLARDEVGAALALLGELGGDASSRWSPAVEAARARIAAERADALQNDRGVSLRAALRLSVPFLAALAMFFIAERIFVGDDALGGRTLLVLAGTLFAAVGAVVAVFRRALLVNRASSRVILSLVTLLAVSFFHRLLAFASDEAPALILRNESSLFVTGFLVIGLGVERRIVWCAAPFAIVALLITALPELATVAFPLAGLCAASICVWAFSRSGVVRRA